MKRVITRGRTVEEATERALQQLGVSRDQAEITVLTEPKPGFLFGLFGRRDAEVEARLIEKVAAAPVEGEPVDDWDKLREELFGSLGLGHKVEEEPCQELAMPQIEEQPSFEEEDEEDRPPHRRGRKHQQLSEEEVSAALAQTRQFVEDVLASMNLQNVNLEVVQTGANGAYTIRLTGESIGILIGRRGQTLDALQYLVNLVANKQSHKFLRITLDAEDYRERRKETLERLAERLANKAIQQRREILLEPMSKQERKIIHAYLQGRTDVLTYSQGEEPYRKVVIAPRGKGGAKQRENRNRRKHSR
jgi:spoIIIJ-associated protein